MGDWSHIRDMSSMDDLDIVDMFRYIIQEALCYIISLGAKQNASNMNKIDLVDLLKSTVHKASRYMFLLGGKGINVNDPDFIKLFRSISKNS